MSQSGVGGLQREPAGPINTAIAFQMKGVGKFWGDGGSRGYYYRGFFVPPLSAKVAVPARVQKPSWLRLPRHLIRLLA